MSPIFDLATETEYHLGWPLARPKKIYNKTFFEVSGAYIVSGLL